MINRKMAIFLDRDGVINKEVNYLSNPEDFEFISGSIEALKILKQKGYLLIVVTNQAGIARGYFTERNLEEIHNKMRKILLKNNVRLDGIFYCPHHPDFTGKCSCRKPNPGMLINAKTRYNIDLEKSYIVGDTLADIQTGIAIHCKTVLVLTGYGAKELNSIKKIKPDMIFENLYEFAKKI